MIDHRLSRSACCATVLALAMTASGCRLAVASLALIGVGTYKAGEAAVGAVGDAAEAGGEGLRSVRMGLAGVHSYGDYVIEQEGSVGDWWRASGYAFRLMNFTNPRGSYDAFEGKIEADTADGDVVIVRVQALAPQRVRLAIRVGVRGDEARSELVNGYIVQSYQQTTTASQ